MSRVVFLGGFGTGHASVEAVGNALESHFDNVDTFTFSDYVRYPDEIRRATKKVQLVTHSAGALAIKDAEINPDSAYLLNPPLPRRIVSLVGRTLVKTARMHTPGIGIHEVSDVPSVLQFSRSSVAELVAHPVANLGKLRNISRFDTIKAASEAQANGLYSEITWTDHDTYYKPAVEDIERALNLHVPVTIQPGEHDEALLRSEVFLDKVLNAPNPQ